MKTANGRILQQGEIDQQSVKVALSHVPIEALKRTAQKLRETIDWYGENHNNAGVILKCTMEMIRIYEPNFKTDFTPAK